MNTIKIFTNGLLTGLFLQLAVGPIFFFIANLSIQKSIADGLAGALAVTIVDYLYIGLSVVGIAKLLEHRKAKVIFGVVSSIVLVLFGSMLLKDTLSMSATFDSLLTPDPLSSFLTVFVLTISSPMTIVFFTSLFTSKALEYSLTRKQLVIFGLGTGLATCLFMTTSVILFSLFKGLFPTVLIQLLNGVVASVLIGYGLWRLKKPSISFDLLYCSVRILGQVGLWTLLQHESP